MPPEATIEYNDVHWTALTAEPRGVDYIEVDAGGVPALWIVPKGGAQDRVIFHSHGGGFICGSIYTHRKLVGHLAKAAGCRALLHAYPYAHQARHPAQIEAAFAAYDWLVGQGVPAGRIALSADSCGAILAFAIVQRERAAARSLPAALMIMSGWLDLAQTGASYEANRDRDPAFSRQAVAWLAANLLGEHDRRDAMASPLYADFAGFPPLFLQAGADETLVDESRMLAARAGEAGVEVRLDVFPGMLHSFQMMAGRAPEADEAIRRFAGWVRPRLGLAANGTAAA